MKHILITGGSDGLGKITAEKLHASGHRVTILSRDEKRTKAVAEAIGCRYVTADVADAQQVEAAIKSAARASGAVDVLINNAGIWITGPIEDNDPKDIERAMAVNALGTIYCTRAVVPAMKAHRSG